MNKGAPQAEGPIDLEGQRLLIVLGSYRSKRHIYEHARALGVRMVVVDGADHWCREDVGGDRLFDAHIAVDPAPFETFPERASAAAAETGLRLNGLGTIEEFAGSFAARIATMLGLPFHSIAAADTARDKHAARLACARAGVPGPRVARIETTGDVPSAARHVGFPAVLKPISGVGSVQAHRVIDESDLAHRFEQVVSQVRDARELARRGKTIDSDRHWFDLMWSGGVALTLESWIEGPKYDVDLLLEDGDLVYGQVTDDLDLCGLRDIRRAAPTALSGSAERELVQHAADCARAIGFESGVFNVEVKRTSDGPRMIEVNGRLGGYSTTDIHRAVWGVDLIEQWLRLSVGLKIEVRPTRSSIHVSESLLPSPSTGVVARNGFLDSIPSLAGVISARPWTFAGDAVAGVETLAPDWLGAIVTSGATREAALARLDEIVARIDWPLS